MGLIGVGSWILFSSCGGKPAESPQAQPAGEESHGTHTEAQPAAASATHACPMHPEETSDKPAKCAKCGMDMVPKDGAAQ
ncbi:MAG: hypothetical protein A3G34_06025 [Candidatus Lindowbacteria bacterium RIFCSPLOWO2_12_FULL_62_27]|nr:MAG: hypothetical protein A3G34_06025 [Candidatus Lindowbacteria bacterium RIFCSPLOWO2_12_FULL_62_27]OGH57467.1 MAG: hypothetical protein A3I06_06470 [Candidatus Lindowbacteria bacterium RIFCSPLOWO2_02_FULL_62_12]